MKKVALREVKNGLSHYVDVAAREEILITRHGRPAAVLIGFKDETDWFDYQLEHDPRFVARIAAARASYRRGRVVTLEKLREREHRRVPRVRRSASEKRLPRGQPAKRK